MANIRVLIADDSSLARGLLRCLLEAEPGIEVVGEACNGRQAVEMVQALRPSLVTMDLEMPVMGGLQAIEAIMCTRAVPILVVSSVADAQGALQAVAHGALDVVGKPDYGSGDAAAFVAKVRLLAGVSVITRMRARLEPAAATPAQALPSAPVGVPALRGGEPVFAIAASTGGPQALAAILPALGRGFPCPVLVAQHISDGFAQGMVDWLGALCQMPVRLARHGDALVPGTIHVSPSEHDLAVAPGERLALRARAPGCVYRPSCDVLLASAAQVFGARAVGVILSGMGHDGAAGLAAIRAAGGHTLAQDEASSVVYGMNRVAIERGAAAQVLPLAALAPAMRELASRPPRRLAGSAA
jgi:two-component system chemotaxis response regulator CheB